MGGFDAETSRLIGANRANWDARTPVHVASAFYGLDGTRDADFWFAGFEWEDVGELDGRDVVHLQCHLGTETIAFARRGARTVGLDFSAASVAEAGRIASRAGVRVEYVQADVHDAVRALGEGRFDLVYTGKGALCYLPDLPRWAHVVAGLLRPAGKLYVVEFHPLLYSLGVKPQGDERQLLLRHDYLEGRGVRELDATYTYTDGPAVQRATVSYEWAHSIGELTDAVIGAGLRITKLRETPHIPWPRWEHMVPTGDGWWRLPDSEPRIPLLYALRADKA